MADDKTEFDVSGSVRVERSDDHVHVDARVFDFVHDSLADVEFVNVFDFDQVVYFVFNI